MSRYQTIVHPLPPYFDESSKVLILGSFPSVNRESKFFMVETKSFWRLIANY